MSDTTIRITPSLVRPEPERDQYGRYVIPNPRTGKRQAWTRATTWASTIAETYNLERWKIRMVALGLTQRADLYAGIAAVGDPETDDGKKKLDKLCEAAKEHAGASRGANLGTALHSFTQQLDIGRKPNVPPPWDNDIAAYLEAMKVAEVEVSPNYVERIVTLPDYSIAGTMDRLVRWRGETYIGDLKTGADLSFSWLEISIQLAIYAHAESIFDVELNRHFPMPEVNRERAIVAHLPAGQARCTLHMVDIDAGWRAVHLCGHVREWRKRKDLARTLESALEVGLKAARG